MKSDTDGLAGIRNSTVQEDESDVYIQRHHQVIDPSPPFLVRIMCYRSHSSRWLMSVQPLMIGKFVSVQERKRSSHGEARLEIP